MSYEDGTVYSKYKKIKDQAGLERADDYIKDEEKTKNIDKNIFEEDETSDVERALKYIKNDMKTYNPEKYQSLVSGVNCIPALATEQFKQDEEDYHTAKKETLVHGQIANRAFHIILSYKGRDVVSPELCHKLGIEFAKRIAGDDFRAVVATHLNTGNIHNHILLSAYSLDKEHPHKYLDKFNQYKYFRKVANELSVEYGLPIFLDDKKTKTISWGEMMKTESGKSWVNSIKEDLGDLMDTSDTFDEILTGMRALGYEITKNKNSITYQKGAYKVRDRRLGREYTEEGFTETLEKLKKVKKISVPKKPQTIDFSPIYISKYDETGHRRGSLIRILLLIKKLIERFGDSFLMGFEGSDRPELKTKEVKLKLIDEMIDNLNEYHIGSKEALDLTIRKLHQGRKELMIEVENGKDIIDNGENLRKSIDKMMTLYDEVKALGIDPEDLVPDYDEVRVRENRAALNPMRPRTKSRLYQSLHDSPYRLRRTFKELSEMEAKEIIKIVEHEETENLPDFITLRKYFSDRITLQEARRWKEKKEKKKRKAYDLSKFSETDKNKILTLKDLLTTYGLYGITTKENAESFKKAYDGIEEKVERAEKSLSSFDKSIRELYRMKKLCEKMETSDFAYGVLFTGSREVLEQGAKKIKEETTNLDYLRVLKKEIDELDSDAFLHNTSYLPDPKQYRLLKDLEYIYPGILQGIRMEDPREVDDAITTLISSGWIEDEIRKEEDREQGREVERSERPVLHRTNDDDKKKRRN